MALDPANLGTHHLLIHFWGCAGHAERALPDANYFFHLSYEPGESHLPHVAGHTFARVGDYDALVAANRIALDNDRADLSGSGAGPEYMRAYHDHDVDFVVFGLTTLGRDAAARAAARDGSPAEQSKVALRLHDDAGVLRIAAAGRFFDRAIADARSGSIEASRRALDRLRERLAGDLAAALAAYELESFPRDPGCSSASPKPSRPKPKTIPALARRI